MLCDYNTGSHNERLRNVYFWRKCCRVDVGRVCFRALRRRADVGNDQKSKQCGCGEQRLGRATQLVDLAKINLVR